MNLLVLWIAGRTMESELGRWRMLALFFAAGLGGTTLLFVFGPVSGLGYAASAAVIGLLAANSIFKYKQREDVRADIGLFVLLVLYSVLVGFSSFGWLILIGGMLIGALVGAVLAYAPRENRLHRAGGRPPRGGRALPGRGHRQDRAVLISLAALLGGAVRERASRSWVE